MKGLELIVKYPLAGKIVKEWFFKSMLESFKDDSVPDEFKEFMLEQGIEDDKIGTLIDINPRMLFDVFDDNDISINIKRGSNKIVEWDWNIMESYGEHSVCRSRKEAEAFAIEAAFEILENKLSPKLEE
jgi:hypothetical protein